MKKMQILLLEDHPVTQKLIQHRLESQGHHVNALDNGHQGFREATANSYDLIISDIEMPHWDGFKFIEAMEVVAPHLPIVIITGSEEEQVVEHKRARYTNIAATLRKPVDFDTLFATLHQIRHKTHLRINKKARIVATIGPSSSSEEVIGKMILAGMDVARLNFSHGSHQQHENIIEAIRLAERRWDKPVSILGDLCGPKIRTGKMENDEIILMNGKKITISAEEVLGTTEKISTIAPAILKDLKQGEPILLDDGLLELRVLEEGENEVTCTIEIGGTLRSNKGMNLPETELSLPSITDKDWQDLKWALDHQIDYIALSFVRSPEDILQLKEYISSSQKPELRVIAKIEKPEAIKHISEIIKVSDGIMIARGDMGVEIPAARVPRIQKKIIDLCRQANTPVITATQMLDSMTVNSRPTRAEVTDVSVAVNEGTDAVMLSGETAAGINPVNAVRTMATIISEEESHASAASTERKTITETSTENQILLAASALQSIKAIILFDPKGRLYPTLSKWNRSIPAIVITQSINIARQALLYNNIIPIHIPETDTRVEFIFNTLERVRKEGYIRKGDTVALVEGSFRTEKNIEQIGTLQLVVA